ncbi:MAG TPA: nucleotidyltransferase family protein [Puia sp.]|nr:nucleotidyltransferase family protein [Puia sp.]
MLTAIVLAAGSSRRMGNINKLLLPYRGKTVLSHTLENILSAGMGEVVVVTGHEAAPVQTAIEGLPVRIVHNPQHESGLTSSIQAGVRAATGDGYMICLADMVLITPSEYAFIKKAFEDRSIQDPGCICLPEYRGEKGNPVVFSSFYREALLQHPEPEGCKGLVRSHPGNQYRVGMDTDHILKDMDDPEQYHSLSLQP